MSTAKDVLDQADAIRALEVYKTHKADFIFESSMDLGDFGILGIRTLPHVEMLVNLLQEAHDIVLTNAEAMWESELERIRGQLLTMSEGLELESEP